MGLAKGLHYQILGRPCVDFREINEKETKNVCPVPVKVVFS